MKILRIKSCCDCKYYDFFYDTNLSLGRFICNHKSNLTTYRTYRIINRKLALKGKIPEWCKLGDYPEERTVFDDMAEESAREYADGL